MHLMHKNDILKLDDDLFHLSRNCVFLLYNYFWGFQKIKKTLYRATEITFWLFGFLKSFKHNFLLEQWQYKVRAMQNSDCLLPAKLFLHQILMKYFNWDKDELLILTNILKNTRTSNNWNSLDLLTDWSIRNYKNNLQNCSIQTCFGRKHWGPV